MKNPTHIISPERANNQTTIWIGTTSIEITTNSKLHNSIRNLEIRIEGKPFAEISIEQRKMKGKKK